MLLQATVLRDFNLLVVLAVVAGVRRGPLYGLLSGALIGFFSGIFSSFDFFLLAFIYGVVGLIAGAVKSKILYKEDFFMRLILSFFGLILFYAMYFFLTDTIRYSVFYTILFSSVLSPFLFKVVER